jgi:phosphopantothenate synthetase
MSVTDPSPQATPESTAPAVTYPSDYEELRNRVSAYERTMAQLEPYADLIEPIVSDDDRRTFMKSALETYNERLEKQKPQYTPELALLREEVGKELTPVLEYVNSERTAKEQAKKDQEAAATAANLAYAQRLVAERPELARNNNAGVLMLASIAQMRGLSLEDAYKAEGDLFVAPPAKKAPPTSLRGDAAAPGVPGESRQEKATTLSSMRKRLADNMRAAQRG